MTGNDWTRSSFCGNATCVEWRRSRACMDSGCVEVGHDGELVMIRDSKNQDQEALTFTREEWADFIRGAKAGEFDA